MAALTAGLIKANLIQLALEAFGATTGLRTKILGLETAPEKGYRADAEVAIYQGKTRVNFVVEARRTLDRQITLVDVQNQLTPYGAQGLLIAPHVTPGLATLCRDRLHLQFMDAAGNAFIDQPGLFVFIQGRRRTIAKTGEGKGGTAAGLRTVFAFLCKPELINAPYREIANAAGVALGTVGWVFLDLHTRGLIAGKNGGGARRLIERKRLLNEWNTNYAIKLRPKLNAKRFRARERDWWKRAKLTGLNAYWGGEVAADRLTGYLKPANVTIYMERETRAKALAKLVAAHHLQADPAGDIEVLDAFWRFPVDPQYPDLVPPILVYADLVGTLEPRNLEVAVLVEKKYFQDAAHPA